MVCTLLPSDQSQVFSRLDAPRTRIHCHQRTHFKLAPEQAATYAFLDRFNGLIYIGKAKNARKRIQSHLAGKTEVSLLARWTTRIASVQVRCAESELEALLVEADLISKHRPGFNRQMRSWRKYCYLVENDSAFSTLSVSSQCCTWKPCYGPYRSRRQAVRIVEALFQLPRLDASCTIPREAIAPMLLGKNDATLNELEHRLEHLDSTSDNPALVSQLSKHLGVLRNAFERGQLLHRAERLLNALLIIPGIRSRHTAMVISPAGLQLRRFEPTEADLTTLLTAYRETLRLQSRTSNTRLPKAVSDLLCVAVQQLERSPQACLCIPEEEARTISSRKLLNMIENSAQ
jgi:predicted GIY-YIG superfamily endonuclease